MDAKDILAALQDEMGQEALFQKADAVRAKHCGNVAQLRGVVHFSNYCCRDDLYCGLRKSNPDITRFRMTGDQIVDTALAIAEAGLGTVVLQSGEDSHYTRQMLCSIIRRIVAQADVAVTLSLGERPIDDLRAFRDAGATRYLMKHETMNPDLYARMRPGLRLVDRIRTIETLRELGYQTGVGNVVGLPGQTDADLAADIVFFQDFQPDMVNIGPFIPHADTPLRHEATGDMDRMLRVFALARIVTQNTHLAAANTVATLDPDNGQYRAFVQGGANVIMPNCNPFLKSKTDKIEYEFQITTKKRYVSVDEAREVLRRAGRDAAPGRGDSLKMRGEYHD
ncbi:[FeFe] hydrogenase H-cluster radical SAM maturase HydE [Desulfolutivibrio sulfoxidireducens]|uniref:[FeFe] hydrogenase H-cluster radical SAM maturase HydE n=1 Tax=Desulfolutivibrio sulfoxidireducens TaxID=2773299 RepID=UPI00159E6BFC|nr:[FeFe] hydrogenase H-cluster radical SAM maturase HydE [Desulfolutivibrio sulfoxidireducens]QLA20465.1 [FeFe] hydrogenase H-cluster radical SAM maturase HydE [Desulfolutivibrio sulfoxidireducens]